MLLDEYLKRKKVSLIQEAKEAKEAKEDKKKNKQTENIFLKDMYSWIINKKIDKYFKTDANSLYKEILDNIGSVLEIGNYFWAKGLARIYCAIRKGTTTENRDAVVAEFINFMSNLLNMLLEDGGQDSKGSLFVSKKLKSPDPNDFNGKTYQEIRNLYDKRVQQYIKQNENPIVIKSSGQYEIRRIKSVEEINAYQKYFNDPESEPWNIFENKTLWDKYTKNGANSFYVCVRNDVDSVKGSFDSIPKNYPYDDYGLSLFYVILSPSGSITNCTSRYNFVHDWDMSGTYSDSGFKNMFCRDAKRIQEALGISSFYNEFSYKMDPVLRHDYFNNKFYKGNNITVYTNANKSEFDVQTNYGNFIYDEFSGFENGPALVKREGTYRYLGKDGKELSAVVNGKEVIGKYDYAEPFSNNRAIVAKNKKYAVINTEGGFVIGFDKGFTGIRKYNDFLFIVKSNDMWEFYNAQTGEDPIKRKFNTISDIEYSVATITSQGKTGIIKIDAEKQKVYDLIPCEFDDIFLINAAGSELPKTLTILVKNGLLGFCGDYRDDDFNFKSAHTECAYSIKGRSIIETIDFNKTGYTNKILAQKGNKDVLISYDTFKEIKGCEFDKILNVVNTRNGVLEEAKVGVVKNGNKIGFISTDGHILTKCIYDSIISFPQYFQASVPNFKYKVLDGEESLVSDILYNEDSNPTLSFSIVQRGGSYFIILFNQFATPVEIGIIKQEVESDEYQGKNETTVTEWIPCYAEYGKMSKEYGWDSLANVKNGIKASKNNDEFQKKYGRFVTITRYGKIVTAENKNTMMTESLKSIKKIPSIYTFLR